MTSGAVVLAALLLQSASGVPETQPTKARLDLRGAGECISRGDLTARVAARSARIQFVDDAEIYAQVVLSSTRPGNVVAELVLAGAGAEQPPRRFVARSCAEAADAIALIIAVTLDPTLKQQPEPPVEAKPPPPPVEPQPPPPAPARTARRHYGAFVAGQTIFGPAPAVMPGMALYGMAGLDRESVWSPALFVGATHAWRNDLAEPGGTASFTLDAASVDVCPLRVGRSPIVARPCASGLVGRLAARGADADQTASEARPFATAGVAFTATAGTIVEVTARVAAGVTLLRDSYYFLGATTFHRADWITIAANLGVGLRWP